MRGELPMPHEDIEEDAEQYSEKKSSRMAENIRKMRKGMLDQVDEATRQNARGLKLGGFLGFGGFSQSSSDDEE